MPRIKGKSPLRHDLAGRSFGHWTVIEKIEGYFWKCRCECGIEKIVQAQTLLTGRSKSCGCLGKLWCTTHGMEGTPTYNVWSQMKRRCSSPKHSSYKYYGAIGIKVCARWKKFENFLQDMGERPSGMTLDRIDVYGHYLPENCRWTTPVIQMRNRRDAHLIQFDGKKWPLADLAEQLGITANALRHRLRRGHRVENMAHGPMRKYK